MKIVCGWTNDSSSQFHSERRLSKESIVSTTGAQTRSMRRGTCGFPTSTEVWWRPRSGAKSAPKQAKSLKPLCAKCDTGKVYESREPNECLQLDFWGPIKYLDEN